MERIKGSRLHPKDKDSVLRSFVHRYTKDHVPAWAFASTWKDGKPYPLQFASDQEWLENTLFAVRTNGRLDRRVKSCASSPTWPNGKPS